MLKRINFLFFLTVLTFESESVEIYQSLSYFVSRDVLSLSKQCFLCKYGAMVVGSGGPNWMAELAKATNLLYCIGIWITWEWNSNGHELLPCYFHVFKNCLLRTEEFRWLTPLFSVVFNSVQNLSFYSMSVQSL